MTAVDVLDRDDLINRYYDPATGQFLSVDPAVGITAAPYTYVEDSPLNASDPGGELCLSRSCLRNDLSVVVHNPVVQTVVTVGACTLGGVVGCASANAAVNALNAYSRYQADGGFTTQFFIGTAGDLAASGVDLTSLKSLKGLTAELQDSLANPVLRWTIRSLGDIPGSVLARILARNAALGGGAAGLDYLVQQWFADGASFTSGAYCPL